MQELVGRLTALDPQASETLKVVSFFDALVTGQVSVEVLARSAALLAGCPAGVVFADGRMARMSPAGDRLQAAGPDGWSSHDAGDDERVWIERSGPPHANDAMLLERLAISVAITRSRATSTSGAYRATEIVLDSTVSSEDRAAAATRLRLDSQQRVRAVALPASTAGDLGHPSTVLSTPFGLARVVILPADVRWDRAGRAGVGIVATPTSLPASWTSALVALRLSDGHSPIIEADQLGSMLVLAEAADASPDAHPDVLALERIRDDRTAIPTLDALAEAGSVRAAAAALGVHHSTVQARLAALERLVGYDPRTPDGRTRYVLARMLLRLRSTRID